MPNNCSKIRCPFNASTFKDCLMACECEYYTKQLTNGDMIKAMFPNIDKAFSNVIDLNLWWNAPYKEVSE